MQTLRAAPPTPAELSASAPRLSSDDAKAKSFHVTGLLAPGQAKLAFEVTWLKAGRYAIRILDAADQTPLFWIVDGHALFYSPLDDAIEVTDNTSADFQIDGVSDKLNFNFGFRAGSRAKVPESIVIDIKSILAMASLNPAVKPVANGVFELSGATPRGSVYRALVDPARSPAFSELKIFPKEDPLHPAFALDKIEAKLPVDPQAFRFPTRQLLAAQMKVQDFTEADSKATMNKLVVSITYRFAMRDPTARDQLEKQLGKIDWIAAVQKDAKASAALRQAIKDAPVVAESAR
ncbi:MAG TPA: hypothetical protein VH370_12350 [Humisphaera sp.]|jgi:hypothetical protein|nr:hypothetical protein [Humisphaera sp.]